MTIELRQRFDRFGDFVGEVASPETIIAGGREMPSTDLRNRLKKISPARWWFLLIVVLPSVLSIIYYCGIATDQYMSEAQFLVRSPDKTRSSGIVGRMMEGVASSAGEQATFTVRNYILSRDALSLLEKNNQIRAVLSRRNADFLSRFPLLPWNNSVEQLYTAYKEFVDVAIDEDSDIATLKVRAFNPKDANDIAVALIQYSEQLVNRMNDRAAHDLLNLAQKEVERAEERVQRTESDLLTFRNKSLMIDPTASSSHMLNLTSQLMGDVALQRARLANLETTAPNSPQIPVLRSQINALQAQVDLEIEKMAGKGNSVSPKLAEYDELELRRNFADTELASAIHSLESARINAEQQHLYLDPIVEPNLADYPLYPKRLKAVFLLFSGTLLVYALGWLLISGAREHVS